MFWLALATALANGGPDDWTHPTAVGSARPSSQVRTRLVSEDLTVTMGDDYDAIHSRAVYRLHNPGGPEEVRYAVPRLDELYPEEGSWNTPDGKASVKLTLGGRALPCTDRALAKPIPVPYEHKKLVNPDVLENPPDEPVWDVQTTTFQVGTVCEATFTVPEGDSELVLEVVEEPLHFSWSTSKDKHPGISDRRWMWMLAPAGSWSGRVEHVSIDVDLGPYAQTATVHGSGWSSEGSHRRKRLTDVDLATQKALAIDLGVREQDFQKVVLQMAGRSYAWKPLGVKVSSTLGAQGDNRYAATNLYDGDPATAWCEGIDGDGVGEWIEIRYSPIDTSHGKPILLSADYISLQMALLPGYAKSAGTWTTNNRVRRVEVSGCDGSSKHTQAVPVGADPRSALYFTNFVDDLSRDGERPPISTSITRAWSDSEKEACVRLRIVEVEKGTKYRDTCISELWFLVDSPG